MGVIAALVFVIGAFLPFVSAGGYSIAWTEGNSKSWLAIIAVLVGSAFILLGNKVIALVGYAVAAVLLFIDVKHFPGSGVPMGIGAILLIVGVAAGLFVTISNLVAKKA